MYMKVLWCLNFSHAVEKLKAAITEGKENAVTKKNAALRTAQEKLNALSYDLKTAVAVVSLTIPPYSGGQGSHPTRKTGILLTGLEKPGNCFDSENVGGKNREIIRKFAILNFKYCLKNHKIFPPLANHPCKLCCDWVHTFLYCSHKQLAPSFKVTCHKVCSCGNYNLC